MFCKNCGAEVKDNQAVCLSCGCAINAQTQNAINDPNASDKDWLVTLLICIFVGGLGIHRFYVGKTGTGIIWLLTFGCFGFGSLIDLIMIICGKFSDGNGKIIKHK